MYLMIAESYLLWVMLDQENSSAPKPMKASFADRSNISSFDLDMQGRADRWQTQVQREVIQLSDVMWERAIGPVIS